MTDIPRTGDRRVDERRKGERTKLVFEHWVQGRFRRATYAFVLLAVSNAIAIGWIYDTRNHGDNNDSARQVEIARQQKDIAQILSEIQSGRKTTLNKICKVDNNQNRAIRGVLIRFHISTKGFEKIDCNALAAGANATRQPKNPGSLKQQAQDAKNGD